MKTIKIKKINKVTEECLVNIITSKKKIFFARISPKTDFNGNLIDGISRIEIFWDILNCGTFRTIEIYGKHESFGRKKETEVQTTSYGSLEAIDFELLTEANIAALEIVKNI